MKSLIAFVKKLSLRQVLTVFFAGLLFLTGTIYTSGYAQAAQIKSQILLADADQQSELLYPGAETPVGRAYKEGELPIKSEKDFRPNSGNLIQNEPSVNQRAKDRIETVKEAVEEASGFLKDKGNEAAKRPELQSNPAVNK
ncbi:MAG: hypothetical protein KME28_00985 [Pelatocladus maniniholoensis HA4357-MV3]|uniref:Uncharacterized protein n=1 Tax=Pelatocladus maniniholoensis HA4357-MV3 TaxID=1117104 RepID=A0A9E3H3B2_9NOST|nr:hypothetical protein [Pelatocladus maniniholoensis HA4357-MV3]BAZ69482.1 hypothetical protein NIES4106_42550 [Fischerella sp. NIES-4106]